MIPQVKVLSILDNFMYKAKRINKPYQALKKTDDFKTFKDMFSEAIRQQGQWVADNLSKLMASAGIEDNLQPLALDQQQKLKGLIQRDLPALTDYVTEFKVFSSLKDFFEWSVRQQYKRWGYIVKAKVNFDLSNPQYIAQLQNRAAYLLNQSSLDSTTIDDVIDIISESRLDGMTNNEVGQMLSDNFKDISDSRGDMIARTESANAVGEANYATAVENGAQTHLWVVAGPGCDQCDPNEADGEIPIDQEFSSGDLSEPAHPNCECYTEAGEINLDSIDIWGGE